MYKEILVAIDINHADEQRMVLEAARDLAVSQGERLHIVSIVPDISSSWVGLNFTESERKRALDEVNAKLHAYVTDVVGEACPVQHIVYTGKVYEEILKLEKQLGIDLIIMGAHKPMFGDFFLGSNATQVSRHASCSVFIVRDKEVMNS